MNRTREPTQPRRTRLLLLIADADQEASRSLTDDLARQHIDAVQCHTAGDALLAAGRLQPDAALVATNLADMPSAEVVRLLRKRAGIPVLLAVGDHDDAAVASALAAGAAAGIARPYRPGELVPILRALKRDAAPPPEPAIEHGGLLLDPASHEVRLHGRPIQLPLREFQLLQFLMISADRVATYDRIYRAVWGTVPSEASNTLAVHVRRLRARLGDDRKHPRIIINVRGIGYRLVAPVRS